MSKHRGEEDFLEQLYRHQGLVRKICLAYCRNRTDREDLYQEIILQLWRSYPSFRGQSAYSTWMYRVALNTAINQTRKFSLFRNQHDEIEIRADDPAFSDLGEEVRLLYRSISRLGKIDRAIILLWLDERSYEEIAATMGISVKNVSVRLVRIREKLSEILKKMQ